MNPLTGRRGVRRPRLFGVYMLGIAAVMATLFPIAWIFTISIKTQRDAFAIPPVWVFRPIWSNYIEIWRSAGFANAYCNSIIVTTLGVLLALLLGIPAAYALERLSVPSKYPFTVWLLLAYMFPEFLFIIPIYVTYQRLGLYDTQLGLALAYQVFALPFAIWLLRGFFAEIPRELDDAARIDGCSSLGVLWRVHIPLLAPGISATAVLTAIWIWNELTIALALTFDTAKTVTVAVAGFRGYASLDWGAMTAASIVAIVPLLLFAGLAQRYIVKGLTLGAVK